MKTYLVSGIEHIRLHASVGCAYALNPSLAGSPV